MRKPPAVDDLRPEVAGGSGGNKMNMADKKGLGQIMPRRIALRYSTKSLVLEYREPNTVSTGLHHRSLAVPGELLFSGAANSLTSTLVGARKSCGTAASASMLKSLILQGSVRRSCGGRSRR